MSGLLLEYIMLQKPNDFITHSSCVHINSLIQAQLMKNCMNGIINNLYNWLVGPLKQKHGQKWNEKKKKRKVQKSIYQPEEPWHQLQTGSLDELKERKGINCFIHVICNHKRGSQISTFNAGKEIRTRSKDFRLIEGFKPAFMSCKQIEFEELKA